MATTVVDQSDNRKMKGLVSLETWDKYEFNIKYHHIEVTASIYYKKGKFERLGYKVTDSTNGFKVKEYDINAIKALNELFSTVLELHDD